MPTSPTVSLAQQLIRLESVTPNDGGCQPLILSHLEKIGFAGEWMNFEEVTNLWATRASADSDRAAPLIVFAGHTDVVPPGPIDRWQFPPFEGAIQDSMLHGRGAADMKSSIACFVTACERFTARHPEHHGTIGILLTSDEEGVARWGTREVMRTLEQRKQHIDMCIIGEPSSTSKLGDVIKVGRRGSINALLKIYGTQCHIAYPQANTLHRAAQIITELAAIEWDEGNANFQPTSFQVSNLRGGSGADNVIPGEVEIQFNLRYSPQITDSEIKKRIERLLTNYKLNFEIDWRHSGVPFETTQGKLIEVVSDCVKEVTGNTPTRSTSGGTSDGRFIAPTGTEVVELGPINATIHQIDECVSTADLDQLSSIYENILEKILT